MACTRVVVRTRTGTQAVSMAGSGQMFGLIELAGERGNPAVIRR